MTIDIPKWLESGCQRMADMQGISLNKFCFTALNAWLLDELVSASANGELPAMTPKEFGEANF